MLSVYSHRSSESLEDSLTPVYVAPQLWSLISMRLVFQISQDLTNKAAPVARLRNRNSRAEPMLR